MDQNADGRRAIACKRRHFACKGPSDAVSGYIACTRRHLARRGVSACTRRHSAFIGASTFACKSDNRNGQRSPVGVAPRLA